MTWEFRIFYITDLVLTSLFQAPLQSRLHMHNTELTLHICIAYMQCCVPDSRSDAFLTTERLVALKNAYVWHLYQRAMLLAFQNLYNTK
jgi:hypothetical protein